MAGRRGASSKGVLIRRWGRANPMIYGNLNNSLSYSSTRCGPFSLRVNCNLNICHSATRPKVTFFHDFDVSREEVAYG